MKNSTVDPSKKALDKTDWKKVMNQSQDKSDRESILDKENPVLVKNKFKKSAK